MIDDTVLYALMKHTSASLLKRQKRVIYH